MDENKAKVQLISELARLRQRVAELEGTQAQQPSQTSTLTDILEQVERAKQEWEVTADSLPQLICLLDSEGSIIRANRTVEKWGLGHVTAVKGQKIQNLLRPLDTDSPGSLDTFIQQAWVKLAEGRSSGLELEDKLLSRDYYIQVHPISSQTGRQSKLTDSYAVIIIRDISERKQTERLKNEFLATISQELQIPLTSIIGYSQLMLAGIEGELSSKILEDVQAIQENGLQLLALINEILDLAEIEAGNVNLITEQVDMESLVEQIKLNHMPLLGQKPVEFKVRVEENLPTFKADKVRLNQVLSHLVINAIRFTDKGQVEVRAFRENDWLCLEVADTGIGISQADLETIFDKFRQVDGSLSRRVKGAGLGLAITQHLVKLHGGTIEVHSQISQGTTVTVRLPLSA